MQIKSLTNESRLLVLLAAVGIAGGVLAFTTTYLSNLNVLIGFCLLPFCLFITGPRSNNLLFVVLMFVSAALALIYKVRICYFFALALYFLWLVELFAGKSNILVLFLIVFMSPVFTTVVTIGGFPLRLMLSDGAGSILNLVGVNVAVEGNIIALNGSTFSVDEACMGLNMLVMSLLMGVFLLAYRYRVSNKTLGFQATLFFFVAAFILNLVMNVIRIIGLVYFKIAPDNPMHEFIGISCLIVYVAVPLHFLSAWLVRRYGHVKPESESQRVTSKWNMVSMPILSIGILLTGAIIGKTHGISSTDHAVVQFGSVEPEKLNDGITKFSTNDLLIYVKTIPEFFTAEHTPLMCWKGSGYDFSGITTMTVQGVTVYKGKLVKGSKALYTTWWYSNGKVETISQVDWRSRMLLGEPKFCLVNVTSEDEETLISSIKDMIATKQLQIRTDI